MTVPDFGIPRKTGIFPWSHVSKWRRILPCHNLGYVPGDHRRGKQSDYDFRLSACPDDPFRYLFDEWVPYYRGKWAIARYLQPKRILEIGVRYGYCGSR